MKMKQGFVLPPLLEVINYLNNKCHYDTDSLFAGTFIKASYKLSSSQLFLESGIRMTMLEDLTGRVALNNAAMVAWDTLFDTGVRHVQISDLDKHMVEL